MKIEFFISGSKIEWQNELESENEWKEFVSVNLLTVERRFSNGKIVTRIGNMISPRNHWRILNLLKMFDEFYSKNGVWWQFQGLIILFGRVKWNEHISMPFKCIEPVDWFNPIFSREIQCQYNVRYRSLLQAFCIETWNSLNWYELCCLSINFSVRWAFVFVTIQILRKGNDSRNLMLFHLASPFQSARKTNIFGLISILAEIIFTSKNERRPF